MLGYNNCIYPSLLHQVIIFICSGGLAMLIVSPDNTGHRQMLF